MSKVIFLDFDGVLCTARQCIASGERGVIAGLDPVALRFLDRICDDHDIEIVISSTWREIGERKRRIFYEIFAAASCINLAKSIHTNWKTPSLADGNRGQEIEKWLSQNECDGYLILDDDPDILDHQKPFFVNIDSRNGMLFEHYLKALKILGIKE